MRRLEVAVRSPLERLTNRLSTRAYALNSRFLDSNIDAVLLPSGPLIPNFMADQSSSGRFSTVTSIRCCSQAVLSCQKADQSSLRRSTVPSAPPYIFLREQRPHFNRSTILLPRTQQNAQCRLLSSKPEPPTERDDADHIPSTATILHQRQQQNRHRRSGSPQSSKASPLFGADNLHGKGEEDGGGLGSQEEGEETGGAAVSREGRQAEGLAAAATGVTVDTSRTHIDSYLGDHSRAAKDSRRGIGTATTFDDAWAVDGADGVGASSLEDSWDVNGIGASARRLVRDEVGGMEAGRDDVASRVLAVEDTDDADRANIADATASELVDAGEVPAAAAAAVRASVKMGEERAHKMWVTMEGGNAVSGAWSIQLRGVRE